MYSHRVHTVLATGTFLTVGFASAVAVGAVPRDHHAGPTAGVATHPAAAAPIHHATTSGHVTRHAAVSKARHQATTTTRAAATTTHSHTVPAVATSNAANPPSPATSPTSVASPAHHHHKAVVTTPTKSHKPAKTSKPAKPAKPKTAKLAARTTPSSSAVQAAIQGLGKYVHSFLTPTAGQVAQFGDLVCGAYDDGDNTGQIETKILQKVQALPLTTILPGAADYVVRTAVKLYCPGYKSRLGTAAA